MQNANITQMLDFISNFSPNNHQVKPENIIIPIPNPISLEGHTNPSKASAKCFVAKIETYDTAIPGIAIKSGLSLDQLLKNCKWD
tara:strand:+ start:64 stop:318 length:255 start_codon:yes stop_codon:yes gene_type:complete